MHTQTFKEKRDFIRPGAVCTEEYVPNLKGKRVAVLAHAASRIGSRHLVDSLLSLGIHITKIFSPEHGFEAKKSDGETIADGMYSYIPIISLYGQKKKPSLDDLEDVDILLFDLQDVGLRFYTYVSTLTYTMEAAAESSVHLVVLDRPNPHRPIVDGPVLEEAFTSFVGLHPVPIMYGMTLGEYALMVKGEKWVKKSDQLSLEIIHVQNYHGTSYKLTIPPSPNLPNHNAVMLYPHLCLFEATEVSVGRGTSLPFQILGHPMITRADTLLIPKSCEASLHPKFKDQEINAILLNAEKDIESNKLDLTYLIKICTDFRQRGMNIIDRPSYFDKLAGTDRLRLDIQRGCSKKDIQDSWNQGVKKFKEIRRKYLIYSD